MTASLAGDRLREIEAKDRLDNLCHVNQNIKPGYITESRGREVEE